MKNALTARFVIRALTSAGGPGKTVTGMVITDGMQIPGRVRRAWAEGREISVTGLLHSNEKVRAESICLI